MLMIGRLKTLYSRGGTIRDCSIPFWLDFSCSGAIFLLRWRRCRYRVSLSYWAGLLGKNGRFVVERYVRPFCLTKCVVGKRPSSIVNDDVLGGKTAVLERWASTAVLLD